MTTKKRKRAQMKQRSCVESGTHAQYQSGQQSAQRLFLPLGAWMYEGSSAAGCHPARSSASLELPKTSSRIIRSVASFRYSCNAFSS